MQPQTRHRQIFPVPRSLPYDLSSPQLVSPHTINGIMHQSLILFVFTYHCICESFHVPGNRSLFFFLLWQRIPLYENTTICLSNNLLSQWKIISLSVIETITNLLQFMESFLANNVLVHQRGLQCFRNTGNTEKIANLNFIQMVPKGMANTTLDSKSAP